MKSRPLRTTVIGSALGGLLAHAMRVEVTA